MAVCSIDEISVSCAGGCGLICTSTHCWGWCEPTAALIETGPATTLARDDSVTLCTKELSRAALVEGLQRVLETELADSADASEERADVSFSGTVDELLDHLGLSGGGYTGA